MWFMQEQVKKAREDFSKACKEGMPFSMIGRYRFV